MIRITLPRSLDLEGIQATFSAIKAAIENESISVIILEGKADFFCIGMSFDYLMKHSFQDVCQSINLFADLIKELYFSKKPTIAVVQGKALAGGVGLAAACDIIIADENASFGFSEALFGLLPGIILPFLLQRLSSQKIKYLTLSANSVNATQAFNLGLVDAITRTDELENCLQTWIKKLARLDPVVISKLKTMITNAISIPLEESLKKGSMLLKEALASPKILNNICNYTEFGMVPWEHTKA